MDYLYLPNGTGLAVKDISHWQADVTHNEQGTLGMTGKTVVHFISGGYMLVDMTPQGFTALLQGDPF